MPKCRDHLLDQRPPHCRWQSWLAWQQLPQPAWSGRSSHAAVTVGGSVLLLGGHDGKYTDHVWCTDDDGRSWLAPVQAALERAAASAGSGPLALIEKMLERGLLADVTFQCSDGEVLAHKVRGQLHVENALNLP